MALAVLMQLNLLIHGLEVSRRSQIGALKIFLVSVPLFLFWGGIQSFVAIYFRESQFLFLGMASVILLTLSSMLCFQLVFPYYFFKQNNFELVATLQDAFNSLKDRRGDFFRITVLLFILSFVPWLKTDWKLVFAVTVTHLVLNRALLKRAIVTF